MSTEFLICSACLVGSGSTISTSSCTDSVHIDYGRMFAHCTNPNSTRAVANSITSHYPTRSKNSKESRRRGENHDPGFYKRGIIGFEITTMPMWGRWWRWLVAGTRITASIRFHCTQIQSAFRSDSFIRSVAGFVARKWIPDSWLAWLVPWLAGGWWWWSAAVGLFVGSRHGGSGLKCWLGLVSGRKRNGNVSVIYGLASGKLLEVWEDWLNGSVVMQLFK